MKRYSLFDAPLKVYGVPNFEKDKILQRLPEEVMEKLPHLGHIGRRTAGGRVAFKTNSTLFKVKVTLKTLSVDFGMSLYACQSVQVMLGERDNCRHIGLAYPPDYDTKVFEKEFSKSSELEQITLYFPRNELLENIEVFVEDDAIVTEPTPYKYEKPVVFYGSSITEGAAAMNSSNAYNATLSRWLDFDYINLGFSGLAKGELEMADYINTLDMSVFVYDYDHNAPSIQHYIDTHKPFFDRIRAAHPDVPIIIMTRPSEVYVDYMKKHREIALETYNSAIAAGDKNVYFIDGEQFYGNDNRNMCSMDDCHPNDLGFYRMASVIRPVLEEILNNL